MSALCLGIVIGFLMCIPLGPINILVINTNFKESPRNALSIALGGACMDFIYFYIILSSFSLFTFSTDVEFFVKCSGTLFIFLYGLKELLSKHDLNLENPTKFGVYKGFALGVFVYISNPTLVMTMTALGGYVKGLGLYTLTQVNIFFTSLGLGLGSFLWFFLLINLINKYEKVIREKYMRSLSHLSGVLMLILSIYMASKLNLSRIL